MPAAPAASPAAAAPPALLAEATEPLLEAISLGRTDIVKKLLEQVQSELKKQDPPSALTLGEYINAPKNDKGNLLQNAVKVS